MAMEIGPYIENVVMTFLIVVTFLVLILFFLYMIYGREETTAATTTPKPRTQT